MASPAASGATDASTNSFHIDPPPGWPAPFKTYSPYQVCEIIDKIEKDKGKGAKAKAMKLMADKNYIPTKIGQLYKCFAKYAEGNMEDDHEWGKVGAPSFVDAKSIVKQIIDDKTAEHGNTICQSDLEDMIKTSRYEKYISDGKREADYKVPLKSCIKRVANSIRSSNLFNELANVANKSESWFGAETSERSTISYMMAVACSHFSPAKPCLATKPKLMP